MSDNPDMEWDVTFKEISGWISTAVVLVLYGYYVTQAPSAATTSDALALYLKVAVVLIVVQIVLHVVAAIVHKPEKTDERDREIATKATRNGYYVLMTGVVLATFQLLMPIPLFAALVHFPQITMAVHVLVLTAAAAELARSGSQIAYYRLGG